MTYRGAMLNIQRYRLRASSCPDIYRNSIITIAKAQDEVGTCVCVWLGDLSTNILESLVVAKNLIFSTGE